MSFPNTCEGSHATAFLEGSLSFRSYPDFKAATQPHVENPSVREIHLDMAGVEYLDSSALGMIL
jgi:anti-anti-sigma factor